MLGVCRRVGGAGRGGAVGEAVGVVLGAGTVDGGAWAATMAEVVAAERDVGGPTVEGTETEAADVEGTPIRTRVVGPEDAPDADVDRSADLVVAHAAPSRTKRRPSIQLGRKRRAPG